MKQTDQQRAELKALAIADRRNTFTAYTVLDLMADLEEAGVELRAERAAAEFRNGDIVQLRAELAATSQQLAEAQATITEVHNWAVCATFATPEDMFQNFGRIVDITTPSDTSALQSAIEQAVAEAVEKQTKEQKGMES